MSSLSLHRCRHFLFKTPSWTTPLFSSSSPGYPLTSGTVYSPPPRLLPRNAFSRSSFKLNKPSKYCSWKCAAVSAIAAAVLLAVLLSYFIGRLQYHTVQYNTIQYCSPPCYAICYQIGLPHFICLGMNWKIFQLKIFLSRVWLTEIP